MRQRILMAGITLALASAPHRLLEAQRAGTVDLGVLGRHTLLDVKYEHQDPFGYGARLGIFLLPNLAIEAEHVVSRSDPDGGATHFTYFRDTYVRLALHRPIGSTWNGIVALGWVRDRLHPWGADVFTDDGAHALVGLQHRLGGGVGFRLDVFADYLPSPVTETPTNDVEMLNWGVQAGFNFRIGREGPQDADGDGVPDALDQCPSTPAGEVVDARGCVPPRDADGDGVMDDADRCAATPAGTRVDASGCPVPVDSDRDGVLDAADACADTPATMRVDARGCPVDSDGDGVVNAADACPETPPGTVVDGRGCALPQDTDGDGVVDPSDDCPDTAAGTRVDARGCAIVFPVGETTLVLDGVTFTTGRAELTLDAQTILDRVAVSLIEARDVKVEVQGHTDNTGARAANLRLSTRRAEAVRDYLVRRGVPADRLTARGLGPDVPRAPNTTAEGRAVNRRVELKRMN